MPKKKVASFFAGIGGFDIGFESAGFDVQFQCEINEFCNLVLENHWPAIPRAGDITEINADDIPDADIWCGGFPCQDLSVARGARGRNGLSGERSGLFFRFAELAEKRNPKVILLENVHGLLNSNNGQDFAELLFVLDSMNYAVSWRLLNSRYFGVPQSRPRIYICAWKNDPVAAGNTLFESKIPAQLDNGREAFLSTSWKRGAGPIAPKIAYCLAATSGRHTGTDWSRTYISYLDDVRRLTPLECERLQGFPDHWTRLNLSNIDVEKSDSLRYHALGNAVSVAVIEWIARRIKLEINKKAIGPKYRSSQFTLDSLLRWPGLKGAKMTSGSLSEERKKLGKVLWPTAGVLWKDMYIANSIFPTPSDPVDSDLMNIVEKRRPHVRYFLSANAAEGILRRVDSQDRHLFPHLRAALQKLSSKTRRHFSVVNDVNEIIGELECA